MSDTILLVLAIGSVFFAVMLVGVALDQGRGSASAPCACSRAR